MGKFDRWSSIMGTDQNRWTVFLICVLISLVFWMLSKLSGQYDFSADFELRFTLEEEEEIITRGADQEVHLRFEASGYDLLGLRTGRGQELELVLDRDLLKRSRSGRYFLLSRDLPLERYLDHKGFQGMSPDTLFFRLEEKVIKEIPIHLNADLEYRKEYGPAGAPMIHPSKIQVSGARSLIEDLAFLQSETLKLSDLHADREIEVRIESPQEVQLELPSVKVSLMVDRYTEGKISFDLGRLSGNKVLFPSTADVYFIVPLRAYELISASDFELELEFDTLDQMASILIRRSPELVRSVRVVPGKVEYVTLKE